ncbi:MAG: ATP-binding cassette domain-containing protein, partial [Thermoplasmata archaeon]|nr:ATP-binding cassette domain-containing protein [Thermoplasmata archaeon]
MSSSERLRVRGLGARWGDVPVLRDISFSVRDGEFLVLMGPNGSGKTTLLRCLAGLEPVTSGAVELDGKDLNGLPPFRRGIGML